jgi:hypothetical protein
MNIRNTKIGKVNGIGRNDMILTTVQSPDIYVSVSYLRKLRAFFFPALQVNYSSLILSAFFQQDANSTRCHKILTCYEMKLLRPLHWLRGPKNLLAISPLTKNIHIYIRVC